MAVGPLPITRAEAEKRGWEQIDFVLVTGDAYVDHPSFGAALIARLLESRGYSVGIIPQPDWTNTDSFKVFGRPRLAFLITSGNVDSMVNNYTAARHRRKKDVYSPNGIPGRRPNRALLVYTTCVKQAYKEVPVVLGGLEASLRRFSHYDYWSDKVRRSVLIDSKADLLVYGMGERQILEIAQRLNEGEKITDFTSIRGTVSRRSGVNGPSDQAQVILLPSFDEVKTDKKKFAESFLIQYRNTDPFNAEVLAEPVGDSLVVQNPPPYPLTAEELDELYELPFTRKPHPVYESVPAIEEVKFSLVSSRGCFGGCSFCSLTYHQGRIVQSRSHESLVREASLLTGFRDFKGYIHDVGGPTANFRHPACEKQMHSGACKDRECLVPHLCKNLKIDHSDYLELLRKLREINGVKKVFIRSGIRFDYLIADADDTFFRELCRHHVSGQLKVAPEHVSDKVLSYMGKPEHRVYDQFKERYEAINRELSKKQYLVPYFISGHPGATLEDAVLLAEYLRDQKFIPKQVQDFYPTPGTLSTCMYYTGIDPRTEEKVHVPRGLHEKAMQRALIQFNNPKNFELVREALEKTGRSDLIGHGPRCLIKPAKKTAQNRQTAGERKNRRIKRRKKR